MRVGGSAEEKSAQELRELAEKRLERTPPPEWTPYRDSSVVDSARADQPEAIVEGVFVSYACTQKTMLCEISKGVGPLPFSMRISMLEPHAFTVLNTGLRTEEDALESLAQELQACACRMRTIKLREREENPF